MRGVRAILLAAIVGAAGLALGGCSGKPDYKSQCVVALMNASQQYASARGAEYWIGEEPRVEAEGTDPTIACPAQAGGRRITVHYQRTCGAELEHRCAKVLSVSPG
jgi:hypothetical protein